MIAMMAPKESWVAKWQRIGGSPCSFLDFVWNVMVD
jgi:hypothetical protein